MKNLLSPCNICPRKCNVDRTKGQKGFCLGEALAIVYSFSPHFGEEPVLSGTRGSGTIFFSGCNMRCCYCQNYVFSQSEKGREYNETELAKIMLRLQNMGVHNINLVTPTHYVPQIIEAINIAKKSGLKLPICYNTSGYDSVQTLKLLEGIVDIYLVDMRYGNNENGLKFSGAQNYAAINRAVVKEMFRQVGNLALNKEGVATQGVIVRHLVLPNNISGTEEVMSFLSNEVSKDVFISLMSQYTPLYKAEKFSEINRRIIKSEYEEACRIMQSFGLKNGWIQGLFLLDGVSDLAGIEINPKNLH